MTQKSNNIPVGYKDSPLGIIPVEWEVKPLYHFGEIYSGGTPNTEVAEYWNGNIAWCTPSDITRLNTKYIESTETRITEKGLKESSATLLPPRSIVVCTRATIGNAAICRIEISTNQGFKNIIPNDNINPEWLYYIIVFSQSRLIRLGCGSTFLEVSKKDFSRFKIPLPPLAEQEKIAEILTTWDKAIEKQTQLIQKLELRKKGLMQQLLTGKKRLPGFIGEWEKRKINQCFFLISETNDGGSYLPMTISAKSGFVSQKKKFDRVIAGNSIDKYILLRKGDFAYNKGNSNLYEMGCIYRLKEEVAIVPFVYICFRKKEFVCGDFYKHYFHNHGLDRQLKKIITSGARGDGLLNVDKTDFFNLEIIYPTLQEQTAIANILSSCDEEIRLAQDKLAAMKEQKKGLMQVLLTGKRRVKL